MKGGVGKTTLSTNVAYCLATHLNKKVLLIDIDPQFNATQCFFSSDDYMQYLQEKKSTIIDLFADNIVKVSTVEGAQEATAKTYDQVVPHKVNDNLYILPGNLNLYQIEVSAGSGKENRLKKYLKEMERIHQFDYVVIDTPPTPSVWMTSALIASNYYVMPIKPDPISFTGMSLLQSIIKQKQNDFDLELTCIGIVLTMTKHNTIVYNKCIETINGNDSQKKLLISKDIPDRTDIPKFQMNQKFILDLDNPQLKSNLTSIVNEIISRIDNYEANKQK